MSAWPRSMPCLNENDFIGSGAVIQYHNEIGHILL